MATQDETLDASMRQAVDAAIRSAKRSLLDFVDLEMSRQHDKADKAFWEIFKRRVHNDLSTLEFQVSAAYRIVRSGGIIPPFGRSDAQILSALNRANRTSRIHAEHSGRT